MSSADGSALIQMGLVNARNGWFDQAAESFTKAAALDPPPALANLYLGTALIRLGRLDEAAEALDRAPAAEAAEAGAGQDLAAAWSEIGVARRLDGRLGEAAAAFARAVEANPEDAKAQERLGLSLLLLNRHEHALAPLRRAVALDPVSAEAFHNLGVALMYLRRSEEAIAAFSSALEINPGHMIARAQRIFLLAKDCDWDAIEQDLPMVPTLGIEGAAISPFMMLSFEDDPERHRRRSELYLAGLNLPVAKTPAAPRSRPPKLRIGYFSADFRNHAMVNLAGRMFELHDRERFSVHGYALGPPSNDLARQRVRRAFDSFEEVEELSDAEIAARAREDGIDIAVDLMGYTEGGRIGIFAHRAAPVQVNFLGYPGTSGASFIDYIIADPVVISPAQRDFYSERLIRLPFTYQPTDDQRPIPTGTIGRSEAGLPDKGFVFCCFNNSYKLKPAEFAIWMRLLEEVDGSALWLLASSARMEENLRTSAARAGVDRARLVFATAVPMADHLARLNLADLFVDTFHYNAHTTASDALWAGLPLVTRAGSGFAARVAASLLGAAGVGELIASSDDEYFELAQGLALDPPRLAEIRARLAANRTAMPLFDSAGFTRHIEQGFEQAYRLFLDGREPEDILVEP